MAAGGGPPDWTGQAGLLVRSCSLGCGGVARLGSLVQKRYGRADLGIGVGESDFLGSFLYSGLRRHEGVGFVGTKRNERADLRLWDGTARFLGFVFHFSLHDQPKLGYSCNFGCCATADLGSLVQKRPPGPMRLWAQDHQSLL